MRLIHADSQDAGLACEQRPVLSPPDFAIVGAPKCATTTLYTMLQKHPQVFLPSVKEPHYFAFDYPGRRELTALDDYDALFRRARASQLRGEVSTTYLRSSCAVDNILIRRPDAKIVAVVRNPVDLFVSWHNECLNALDEDERDPERAWRLQDARAAGQQIPKLCKEPQFLQYRKICSLGEQIASLVRKVPVGQLLVLRFEDFRAEPKAVWSRLTAFLKIASIEMETPARENSFGTHRSPALARLVNPGYGSPFVQTVRLKLRPVFHALGFRPIQWLFRYSLRPVAKPALSETFRRELTAVFEDDMRLTDDTMRRLGYRRTS